MPAPATAFDAYKSFPPGWSHLYVPTSSRRAALAGLALHASCRTRAIVAQSMAWTLVAVFGPRILPGRRRAFHPPMPPELWAELLERWRVELGSFSSVAIYQRLQAERSGLAALLIGERGPRAFLKLQHGARPGLATEALALRELASFRPTHFRVPALIGSARFADWSYVAMTPLPESLHLPPRHPPLREICREISLALRALPRSAATPAHWEPMHGDLTPWNLRRFPARGLAIVDWEDAGWGPPDADVALYRASAGALAGSASRERVDPEALDFWETRIRQRDAAQARDARLTSELLDVVKRMRAAAVIPHA